jgi:hypothetical protein
MDIDAYLRAIEAGIGLLPATMIVVVMLGGPTAIWLLYRFYIQPRSSPYRASPMGVIWICAGCRSANELTASRCYRCHREADEAAIGLVDPGSGELIPVPWSAIAPDPEPPQPRPGSRPDIAPGLRGSVAVGPGKPEVKRPRRAVGPGRTAPAGRSAPKGSSAPKRSRPRPRAEG